MTEPFYRYDLQIISWQGWQLADRALSAGDYATSIRVIRELLGTGKDDDSA